MLPSPTALPSPTGSPCPTGLPSPTALVAAGTSEADIEVQALAKVAGQLDLTFAEAVSEVFSCSGKVFVSGSGTSSAIARRCAHLLSVVGTPSVFLHAMDALHGSVGAITEGDVVLAFSKGGGSSELNDMCAAASRQGARLIAVTETPNSVFAEQADIVAVLHTDPAADPGGMIGMGSTLSAALWADALTRVLLRLRQRSWEEVFQVHPAGAVGKRGIPAVALPRPILDEDDQGSGS